VNFSARVLLVFLLALPSAPLFAQSPGFGETIEVRVANIDVIVATKEGGKVSGLRVEDFELFVDGEPQQISNFDEIRRGTPLSGRGATLEGGNASPEAGRRRANVVFFVDIYSIEFRRRGEVLAALNDFAKRTLQTGDQVMIAVWNRRLLLPVPFTTDLGVVDREIAKLTSGGHSGMENDRQIAEMNVRSLKQSAEMTATSRQGGGSFADAYAKSLELARARVEEQGKMTKNMADAVEDLLRSIAGVEGRKLFVFIGENFPKYPYLGFYQYINDLFQPYSSQFRMSDPQMEASRYSLAELPGRIARVANANEVVIHSIYSGDRPSDSGVDRPEGGGSQAERFLDFANTGGTLAMLSKETGGAALVGSRNFALATRQISDDLDGYYSLAYRVPPGDNKPRRIDVRAKNPAFIVRARRAYVPKTMDEEIAEKVASKLVQQNVTSSPEITVRVGEVKKERRGRMRVPVEITFPTSLLTMLSQDGKQVGGFEIVIASRDDENRLSEVSRKVEQFAWADGKVPPTVSFTLELVLRNRPGAVSVGVVDRLSKLTHFKLVDVAKKG